MFCECIWGGGAAPSPPTPLQLFFFLALPPLQGQPTPHRNVSTSNWNHRKKLIPKIIKINSQNISAPNFYTYCILVSSCFNFGIGWASKVWPDHEIAASSRDHSVSVKKTCSKDIIPDFWRICERCLTSHVRCLAFGIIWPCLTRLSGRPSLSHHSWLVEFPSLAAQLWHCHWVTGSMDACVLSGPLGRLDSDEESWFFGSAVFSKLLNLLNLFSYITSTCWFLEFRLARMAKDTQSLHQSVYFWGFTDICALCQDDIEDKQHLPCLLLHFIGHGQGQSNGLTGG